MAINVTALKTIRANAIDALNTELNAPTGNHDFYGRYLVRLTEVIDWADRLIQANEPVEGHHTAYTSGGR